MLLSRFKSAACLALNILALAGCEHRSTDPVVSKTEKWFIVTEVKRPKHFYVSFREEGTGFHYRRQYVSKHCSAWDELKIGSRWKLVEVVRQGKNGKYSTLEGVRGDFCDRIRGL